MQFSVALTQFRNGLAGFGIDRAPIRFDKIGLLKPPVSGSQDFMTLFSQIDLMARGASLALLLVWSWILIRDHNDMLAARVAVAMNFAIVCYLLTTGPLGYRPSAASFVLSTFAGMTPGLFWLFSRTWFNDRRQIGAIPIVLIALSIANISAMQWSFGRHEQLNLVTGAFFRIGMLAFAGAGLWEAWQSRKGDLVEFRRKMRPRIVVVVGLYVILIAVTEVAVFNYGAPLWIARSVGSSTAIITLLFCAAIFGMRTADLFGAVRKPYSTAKPVANEDCNQRLLDFMKQELPHRDERMTIAKLATSLGEQEYRLRRTINGALGHRNFAAFLNSYRLAEVKEALADASQNEVPIITIALDAGFGSLGPFNRAFRDSEGMTPSEYRAQFSTAAT